MTWSSFHQLIFGASVAFGTAVASIKAAKIAPAEVAAEVFAVIDLTDALDRRLAAVVDEPQA